MRSRILLAVLVLLGAGAIARAGGAPRGLVVVYPGGPGDQHSAKNTMDTFAEYLAKECGMDAGALSATYFNDEKAASLHLQESKPTYGILTLQVYLKWKSEGRKITLLAQSERQGRLSERYHVLVPATSKLAGLKDLRELKGATIASSYLDDRRFASKVVFDGVLDATANLAVVDTRSQTRSVLRALIQGRKLASGKVLDAVLVDDFQLEGIADLAETKQLRTVWSSRPLPTPAVVAFDNAGGAELKKLQATLTAMSESVPGKKILAAIQATGFKSAAPETYAPFEKGY